MSGEWKVEVVRIGEVEKHPNADTLSITKIHGGYPVIFRSGDDLELWCGVQCINTVPVLDTFTWTSFNDRIAAMAEGDSWIPGANHIREGIVIKPLEERWDPEIGRVILKLHGEGYLTSKNT